MRSTRSIPHLIGIGRSKGIYAVELYSALTKIGKPALPYLIEALSDPSTMGKLSDFDWAAEAIGSIGRDSIPYLTKMMDDLDNTDISHLRALKAFLTTGEVGLECAPSSYSKLLNNSSELIRIRAINSLLDIGANEMSVPLLVDSLESNHCETVRCRAALALANFEAKSTSIANVVEKVVVALVDALDDQSTEVQENAILALKLIVQEFGDRLSRDLLNRIVRGLAVGRGGEIGLEVESAVDEIMRVRSRH